MELALEVEGCGLEGPGLFSQPYSWLSFSILKGARSSIGIQQDIPIFEVFGIRSSLQMLLD